MTKKIRIFSILITINLLAFLSMASQFGAPMLTATPTKTAAVTATAAAAATTAISKARATAMALESQGGHSDGMVFLGVMIFIFIATPILLRNKRFHSV